MSGGYVSQRKLTDLIDKYADLLDECREYIYLMHRVLGETIDERIKKIRAIRDLSADEVWEVCQAYKEAKAVG